MQFNIKQLLNYYENTLSYIRFLKESHQQIYNEAQKYKELTFLLKKNSIETYFQPILSLQTGETLGYEALNRPLRSSIFSSTEQFYDYIGQSRYVFNVEKYLRRLTFSRFQKLHQHQQAKDQLIFINVNPKVITDPSFQSGKTIELLKRHHLSPCQVVLEVTEKEAVIDYNKFVKVIHHYRNQGLRIAVDDAGSGFNSLKTIVYLQPEFIKIDKSILQHVSRSEPQQEMVKLLLAYATKFQTKVIAEGIEHLDDYLYLKKIGLHYGQGYLLGKPEKY